ncbi:hypothetical protein N7510_002896 [Penicillium lagena]|uniref:uncharacterized protein n=1 Tax=Penicillium lagena TaxID=94218 RepID=UPI00253FBE0E|nr:uncharacterized protein N7510_002896 [Penicillium lagena]KAJ5618912.1 hypothetical protein N7510_002896 [Penicillium lagena]
MSSLPSPQEAPMSQDLSSLYVRTHEYSAAPKYPSNSAVRYFVPADDNNDSSSSDTVVVDNKVFNPASHTFADDDFICPGFFERAQLDGFTRRFNHAQWSYEMRREAQPVLPFLSLGPSSCLRERATLHAQGFTLLLAIRNRHSAQARLVSGDKAAAELGIIADTVDVLDNQELISAFPRAIRRINDHLAGVDSSPAPTTTPEQKKKVLVFCESGNERSASVVIAYLMVMLNMDAARATHMIQQHRFCVSIEDPLKRILVAFESILVAKRDVEHTRRTSIPSATAPTHLAPPPMPMPLVKKRSFQDRSYDDDNDQVMADSEMDLDDEEELLAERRPIAPFQDRVV